MKRRYLIAGNWKMNGTLASNAALLAGLAEGPGRCPDIDLLVCPAFVHLDAAARQKPAGLWLGAQNLADQPAAGAYTGEVLASMLVELGVSHVLVGHSERRALYGEDDARVARKVQIARAAGLVPVLCLGETLDQREAGQTEAVLARQLEAVIEAGGIASLEGTVLAYEPVWAIGTGRTASPEQAQAAHAFLRARVAGRSATIADRLRILYGGSMKADNAPQLLSQPDVDGGLIGGASLKAADFLAICQAAQSLS
ncbi:MAG TPA: triose-phosphate isomerase [Nevskiaceae bacterium]|nr:triose-phosphate isomerase [Nevskiaceae bacterium]